MTTTLAPAMAGASTLLGSSTNAPDISSTAPAATTITSSTLNPTTSTIVSSSVNVGSNLSTTITTKTTTVPNVVSSTIYYLEPNRTGTNETGAIGHMLNKYLSPHQQILATQIFFGLLALTSFLILILLIRNISLRRRRNKAKKYGVIASANDEESRRLHLSDDNTDEEDLYVFKPPASLNAEQPKADSSGTRYARRQL